MKYTKSHLIISALIVFNVALVGAGIVVASWPAGWLGYYRTLEVKGSEDRILNPNKQVRPGEVLIYQLEYCKYTDKQAQVTRQLRGLNSKAPYPLLPSTNNVARGCTTATVTNLIVPEGVAPGYYRLELSATYQLNPLRSETVSHHSEIFEVLPKATSSPVSAPDSVVAQSAISTSGSVQTAPTLSTAPFHTDPVTQEPTQPTPAPTSIPAPQPQPDLLTQALSSIKGLTGL